ncbi:hypothetical protein HG535_0F01810 [Zygotorulaspora mrakii]|uniref:BAH domain-containing protein n=1 Tax=Zygotorulaspora mrakii TaxID=42260 RepID=A0A7H9B503_ZYGMR|nr:uncharacterized protein HG535_0F01810 [Zygotorulaspora mrakii]QLG73670.1 hypothetical protein HG535_0F01810 [Zygotorulaspora mrakii]
MSNEDVGSIGEEARKELQSALREEYDALFRLKEDNGLEIYPIFNVLPAKKEYPDYYALIKNPVSFNTLKKRVLHYMDAQSFVNDLVQIPWNAKTYNTKESAIYKYATILEKYINDEVVTRLKKKFPSVEYPYLGPLPDEVDTKRPITQLKTNLYNSKGGHSLRVRKEHQENRSDSVDVEYAEGEEDDDGEGEHEGEGEEEDDDEYIEGRKLPNLRINLHRGMTNSQSGGRSNSSTPKPSYGRHQQQRTHMRRGRPPVIDLPYVQRMKNILKMLKKEIDDENEPLTATFEKLPDELRDPKYYSMVSNPICLEDIRKKIKTRKYKDFQSFQNDFNLMLANYRLYHRTEPQYIKRAATLEKKYNAMARHELSKPDRDYMPEGELRYPIDELVLNGKSYRIGDWVLLENPNDSTKPTVAQIFRLWSTSDGKRWLNACWYLRPEQTVHRVDRLFYKNEVVKSGQYRDHLVEEIVGKCYVVHFTRFQRGDPDIKLEGPLFVCEFRYNENEKIFNKIRTWKACLPEEIRDQDEATIPVNGRKFLKYPSPLRHLLPSNATPKDPIPQPTEGAVNAPPLIGGVYLRPKLERDDLGEYATSDDCPRYIIRPGDPAEDGKMDFETSTIITSAPAAASLSKTNLSNPRLAAMKQNRSGTGLNSLRNGGYVPGIAGSSANLATATGLSGSGSGIGTPNGLAPGQQLTVHGLKQHQLNKQQLHLQQQQQQKRSQASGYSLTTIVNNLAAQASKTSLGISVDAPGAYLLPISITKNVDGLLRADYASQVRRLGKDQVPRRKRNKGEVIWFRGPSVAIEERLLNSGDEFLQPPLNRWFSKNKKQKTVAAADEQQDIESAMGSEDEQDNLPDTFPLALRPSAKFMAFKIASRDNMQTESL